MYGTDEPEYDYRCPHCGRGDYFEVGMGPFNCEGCGGSLQPPSDTQYLDTSNDDVLLDADYVVFDSCKAFRLLKQLGLLDQCCDRRPYG